MNSPQKQPKNKKPPFMKSSKSSIHSKTHAIPDIRFEDQKITSFSGLTVFQKLFDHLNLKQRLRHCFKHRVVGSLFGEATIVLLLVVHLLLGYKELRHLRFYNDDPMVKRLLGLKKLPDVATISRTLSNIDIQGVNNLQTTVSGMVLSRLKMLSLPRITLDFDGSVISSGRYAEGLAVGFNKKKKGQRSYYPLFCTVAQTGQVLDILHRSGNVHDSNGAQEFILNSIKQVRKVLPKVIIEVRMDSAFFSEEMLVALENNNIEYTVSVPFLRIPTLKKTVENRRKWLELDNQCDYFDAHFKLGTWKNKRRFIVVRQACKVQQKKPIQLDLFTPFDYGWEFKVVLTNKKLTSKKAVAYHNGRGSQESIFAELKSDNQMGYIPTRTWTGNKVYLLSVVMAHNLSRELQMITKPAVRSTEQKRPALWKFTKLDTLRKHIIQRAGRIIQPQGKLVLSMAKNESVKDELLHFLKEIERAA